MNPLRHFLPVAAVALAFGLVAPGAMAEGWSTQVRENPELPGDRIDVLEGSDIVASLIYGEGQMKTFLNVYDEHGTQLTMSGLDADGEEEGRFPHHRGIFIGWNQVRTDLGEDDLWHMRSDERMELAEHEAHTTDEGVRLDTVMHWRSGQADDDENLVLSENRRLTVSRPGAHRTVVDFDTTLKAERDVELDGDLQHAGVHYRAHHSVNDRSDETSYLWEPADLEGGNGRIVHDDLRWVQFFYPIGDNWYLVTQLDAPSNPTEELSWRDYGRFGFFHKDELEAGETRDLSYRFIIEQVDAPADGSERSEAQARAHRAAAEAYYDAYVTELEN